MTLNEITQRPLRLWPGVLFAALQPLVWFGIPRLFPEQGVYGFLGAAVCGLGILLWWLFFSRAPWSERLGMFLLMIVAMFATSRIVHVSVAGAGQGMMFYILGSVLLCFVFVVAVVASHRLGVRARRAVMVAAILIATGGWAVVRIDGISSSAGIDVAWRWTPTPEERLLAQAEPEPPTPAATPAPVPSPATAVTSEKAPAAAAGEKPAESPPAASAAASSAAAWPGFRGPHRDSIVPDVRIETNWAVSPPVEIWRRPIGPAWSSFAVSGDLVYTQEQRGDQEIVACYNLKTGQPVWRHRDATRFWEANAGPGPRGTPTLSGGRVYTFGATGIVNALDAATGAAVWSRNVTADAEVKVPYWGFSSSPLVLDDLVIVAASGRLIAYDIASGKPRWLGPAHKGGYSSPHLVTIDGVPQIVLLSGTGATGVAPADGAVLWEHAWQGVAIVQPGLTPGGDILMGSGAGMGGGDGMSSVSIEHGPGGWKATERWMSRGLKPYFNDFVVHKGHAFGFDGSILACIDLTDGTRKWKGGRYGNGQLILLPDQDLLLVLSEEGELALVSAATDKFSELARVPAIEGKTWNHPVLVGDVLLVRNDREMAAFRLKMAK